MSRTEIESQLVVAERQVSQGMIYIARQTELVAKLVRDGHDTTEAKKALANFEASAALHVAHRDRLVRELVQISNG